MLKLSRNDVFTILKTRVKALKDMSNHIYPGYVGYLFRIELAQAALNELKVQTIELRKAEEKHRKLREKQRSKRKDE